MAPFQWHNLLCLVVASLTLARMHTGMRLIVERLGLPASTLPLVRNQSHVAPVHNRAFGSPRTSSELAKVCPNVTRCEQFIRAVAPFDHLLYERVSRDFDTLLKRREAQRSEHSGRSKARGELQSSTAADESVASEAPCAPSTDGFTVRKLRHLTTVNSSWCPDLAVCGMGGGVSIGADTQLGALHDALAKLNMGGAFGLRSHGGARGLCYHRTQH
jgi:hypothetical protein